MTESVYPLTNSKTLLQLSVHKYKYEWTNISLYFHYNLDMYKLCVTGEYNIPPLTLYVSGPKELLGGKCISLQTFLKVH